MSAASQGLAARRARNVLLPAALIVGIALWLIAAHALLSTTVPSDLDLPHVDPRSLFSASFLARSRSYEELLDIDALLTRVVLVLTLAVYAWRGARLMRESAAGPVGTGMLIGMLGFAIVWLTELPFSVLALWWERRHGVSRESYFASIFGGFLSLAGEFVFISIALLIAMALARLTRRWWWAPATVAFAALSLLWAFLGPYLLGDTKPLRNPETGADVRTLARAEGIPGTKALVQTVHRQTTAPNAESVGFGPTRRVILWDTLLDGRFDRREVRVVIGHELGHLAHHHVLKRVGWLVLFLIPASALVALATSRRGGLGQPEAVPLALLVFIVLQLLAAPLQNIVYRHQEAEADWSALRATRDPQAARSLFENLAETSLADPDPPTWSYVLFDDHPTVVQRIAMADAWQQRGGG